MKLCTKIRADVTHLADGVHIVGDVEIVDVSLVPDDHEPGVDPDGFLHVLAAFGIGTGREPEDDDG